MLHAGRWSERPWAAGGSENPRASGRRAQTPGCLQPPCAGAQAPSPLSLCLRCKHLASCTWLPGQPARPPALGAPERVVGIRWPSSGFPGLRMASGFEHETQRLSVWYQRPLSKRVQLGPWDRRQVKTRQPGGCRCRLRRTGTMQAHQARARHRPRRGGGRSRDPGSTQLCPACGGIGLWVCLSALYHRLCERRPHAGSS